jgi:hypothetical protein
MTMNYERNEIEREIEREIARINEPTFINTIDGQIAFLTQRQTDAMEFEEELTRQIERNKIAIDVARAAIESLESIRKFTPAATAKLDIIDGCKCVPSAHYSRLADIEEYVLMYLHHKPDDRAALKAAVDYGILPTTHTDADIAEMHADAMAVDDAQSEYTDWRT